MANKVTLTNETIKAGVDYVLVDGKAEDKLIKFVDLLWNDGVRTSNLTCRDASGKIHSENDVLRDQVKDIVIIPAFSKANQALLSKATNTLAKEERFEKREVQGRIGTYMKRFEKKIQEREENEMIAQGLVDPKMPKSDLDRYHGSMDDAIRYLGKLENPSFDVVEVIKNHKALKGSVPSV
jgi:uncharacterized protein YggU (UPF0235/DUF167 family)